MTAAIALPRNRVLADALPGGLVRDAVLVLGGTGFIALSAQVAVPLWFTPVPLSLQTLAVLLTGAALGLRRGALSSVLYLVAGVAGAPWFAQQHSGWQFASFGLAVPFTRPAFATLAACLSFAVLAVCRLSAWVWFFLAFWA